MKPLAYWHLCTRFTIVQAALLIIGHDPGGVAGNVEEVALPERPPGYEAAKAALVAAVVSGEITWRPNDDGSNHPIEDVEVASTAVDLHQNLIDLDRLKKWLAWAGFKSNFFFDQISDQPDYLDPTHARYAPKLAAAIRAWQAVGEPSGKSPKQALEKWLREHAADFGLTDGAGNPVALAMSECSTVANWRPGGGASKTPS